jgi:hypothetical protein
MPDRSISPARLKVPRATSRSTRTRTSALASTAATGGAEEGCGGRFARSIRRLYSGSGSMTLRELSVGRGGCCAAAWGAGALKAASVNATVVILVMVSSSPA